MILINVAQFLLLTLPLVASILQCGSKIKGNDVNFFRMKTCHKLNSSIIARANLKSFQSCLEFATEKRGLAFNFCPYKLPKSKGNDFRTNCEVLGCPDVDNLTSLIKDTYYDYYTLYGNTEAISNATCLASVGVFTVYLDGQNYTKADNICRTVGGHLAHVLSDIRTDGLAHLVSIKVLTWSKVAYVGLNDIQQESLFVTALNQPIDCYKYRAWAPGHPRSKRKQDDCVIIDSDKMWRTINCARTMPFICEIHPKPPFYDQYLQFNNTNCSDVRNRTLRTTCQKIKGKYNEAVETVSKYKKRRKKSSCGPH